MITMVRRTARSERVTDDVSHDGHVAVHAFPTALGWIAVAYREDALCGVSFGHTSRRSAEVSAAQRFHDATSLVDSTGGATQVCPNWVKELVDGLERFAADEAVDFSEVPLALEHLTPFGRRVVAECRRIRWGETRSYGELAKASGRPGAARAVGSVMAKNRFPLIVPCHRVLAAGGAIGGYSAPEGLAMKRRLLAMEGRI
jgi:methylated-DNA-[protein]-cysteine S-methyltransferase